MATFSWKGPKGWSTFYAGLLGGALQAKNNLSDVADRKTSLENLNLIGEVTEHYHDTRYLPIIDEKIKEVSGGLSGNMDEFKKQVQQLIDDAKKQIADLSTQIQQQLDAKSKELDKKIQDALAQLQNLSDTIQQKIDDLKAQLQSLQDTLDKIKPEILAEIYKTYYVGNLAPNSPAENTVWFDINKGYVKYFKNSKWHIFDSAQPGMIMDWYGASTDVPEGWAICDGTNGTPDLRDKFVVAAGGKYEFKATGGEESHTLTEAELPAHSHSGSADAAGDHHHGAPFCGAREDGAPYGVYNGQHRYYGAGKEDWDNLIYNTSTNGAHTHTITMNSSGGNQAHNNLPPYVALFKIIKL